MAVKDSLFRLIPTRIPGVRKSQHFAVFHTKDAPKYSL